ncbi:MAG TPA: proton-conducting transporter membrane subunit [Gaiella sp.]|uniref:proton-conducting transporter transmembrane domain-containing protein n=1 Tax=Gaiella sp. TaxID=2663207 RepID=UPI002D7E35F1|nr:proton-conducting transporter membrane subunit [Gaiella sp.]HET9287839.1 proton-conducting transporter membrane subunit [Gaiella sp.]
MTSREALALAVVGLPTLTAILVAVVPRRVVQPVALAGLVLSGLVAIALGIVALGDPSAPEVSDWVVIDAAAGLMVGVIGLVGLASALASPAYLHSTPSGLFGQAHGTRAYYAALAAFVAVLTAVPLAGNLGAAWLLVEATTAASAILVGFSGKPRALEAGWKYLLLTSLGLGFSLLGIVLLASVTPGGTLDVLSWRSLSADVPAGETTLVAFLLVVVGLAAKIGWAPVHNWLPDAHSEAPPPVSALLSAALLPAVLLVAWRVERALEPAVGESTGRTVLIGFGLVSLGVAVPFLWRPLAWKRLLAYSSLEHMGVIALGIGFGTPLALAGVAVHIAGHAVAKALGFYAATPLLGHEPRAAGHAVTGIARTQPALGTTMGISLGALAGLPPSPLFLSEILVIAGGFDAGRPWAAAAAAVLLALGFVGLAHALVETTGGSTRRRERANAPGLRSVVAFGAAATVILLALAGAAFWLPDTDIVEALVRGVG